MNDIDKLTNLLAPGLATKQVADAGVSDTSADVVFVGDMTADEMATLLKTAFERAFAEMAGQMQQVTKQLAQSVQAGTPKNAERFTVTTKSAHGVSETFKG